MTATERILLRLETLGWRVDRLREREAVPDELLARYPTMPSGYRELIETVGLVSTPNDTAWLVSSTMMSGRVETAYAWNEWEMQSLEAASDDADLTKAIRAFWDCHVPVFMSVKSGYAYFALDIETGAVVRGEEPEYEAASPLASSLEELFQLIESEDSRIRRWI